MNGGASTRGGAGGSTNGGNTAGGYAAAGEAGNAGGPSAGGMNGGANGQAGEASVGGSGGEAGSGEGGAGGGASADYCRGIELPNNGYYAAPGLCVRAVAANQGSVRQLTFDAQGNLLAVTSEGKILRYRDVNDDGVFAGNGEITQIADTGGNGNNVHFDAPSGFLYAGTPAGVRRWAYSPTAATLGAGEVVVTGQPSTGRHPYHTVHVYNGWLYVHSGSADNAIAPAAPEYDNNRSVIKRFALADFTPGTAFAWSDGATFARGLRNVVGFTQDSAGRLYGVENGIDDLLYQTQDIHLDNPGEELVLLRQGEAYGFPYCFSASHVVTNSVVVSPGTQLAGATSDFTNPHDNAWCATNSVAPVTLFPPHSAPLDIAFFDDRYPAGGLPESFRGGAFVSLHGSWNTNPSVGHQIVFVPFDAQGNAPQPTANLTSTTFPFPVVFGGGTSATPRAGTWSWENGSYGESPVRPVGVAVSPRDGTLFVSSDNAAIPQGAPTADQGYIYRIAAQR